MSRMSCNGTFALDHFVLQVSFWPQGQSFDSQRMKMRCLSVTCRVGGASLLCAIGMALMGCATSGYQTSDATARSLQHASYTVQAESRALHLTLQNLKDLVNTPGADLKPQ